MQRTLRILVTGGGTGGHTVPALATIAAIQKLIAETYTDIAPRFLYVGSAQGLEATLAAEAKIGFVSIATGKLRRSANPLRMLNKANLRDAARVPLGFLQALKIVKNFNPDIVFSTGGYVSVPSVFAAGVLGCPVLMHEQTVQIGLANRLCAKIASRIALSYPESANELGPVERKKAFVTGGVVRKIVVGGDACRGRERYGFDGDLDAYPVVYVTGGAQGSSIINNSVLDGLNELVVQCCVIHQCGKQKGNGPQDETKLRAAAQQLPFLLRKRYVATQFVGDEIGDVYAASSIVVGRSGAGTVSEVCAVGKPSVFVPLVPTGGDEQTRNAQRLQSIGAAVIIKQNELSGPVLVERVTELLADPEKLMRMGTAAKTMASPNAAELLAKAVIDLGLKSQSH